MIRIKKTKLILLFGLLLVGSQNVSAQLDTKHWIPPFYAKPDPGTGTQIEKHFVSLSTPATDTISVAISAIESKPIKYT